MKKPEVKNLVTLSLSEKKFLLYRLDFLPNRSSSMLFPLVKKTRFPRFFYRESNTLVDDFRAGFLQSRQCTFTVTNHEGFLSSQHTYSRFCEGSKRMLLVLTRTIISQVTGLLCSCVNLFHFHSHTYKVIHPSQDAPCHPAPSGDTHTVLYQYTTR